MKLNKKHPLYQEDIANILNLNGLESLKGKKFLITGETYEKTVYISVGWRFAD